MKIAGITYFPYRLIFKEPLVTSSNTSHFKNGFIIEFLDSEGNVGIGETALLPAEETNSESLQNVKSEIVEIIAAFPNEVDDITDLEDKLNKFKTHPSVHHGFEQAILNLFCVNLNKSLPELLNVKINNEVDVNSLIGIMPLDKSIQIAEEMVKEGFTSIKIKTGREDFKDDLLTVENIHQITKDKAKLRIDVNGKWNLKEAVRYLTYLKKFDIEYAEQPVSKKEDLVQLSKISPIPIAADESIRNITDAFEFIEKEICSVLILKPMMLGGILNTLKIIRKAEERKIKVIISNTFESSVGIRAAIFLASVVNGNYSHGLGNLNYFESDLYDNPFRINNGKIYIEDANIFSNI